MAKMSLLVREFIGKRHIASSFRAKWGVHRML